jgi:hypothetical protein
MRRTTILALALAVTGAACTGRAAYDADQFRAFVDQTRAFHYDYQPVSSPRDLADQADVVVTGRIVDVQPGQAYAPLPDTPAKIVTSVLHVSVTSILAGDASLVVDRTIYIEIPHPAFVSESEEQEERSYDLEAFAATVPRTAGVFFLNDRTNEPYWDTVIGPNAGRPRGAPITTPFVQGFLLEGLDGRLVSVMAEFEDMPAGWKDLNSLDDVLIALSS